MPTRKSLLLGRWRITEMELWDTDFVDMLEPAYITFEAEAGSSSSARSAVTLIAATAPMACASPGKASTKWTPPSALAQPNSLQMGRSLARAAFTAVMSPPSRRAGGEFLRSLLRKSDSTRFRRLEGSPSGHFPFTRRPVTSMGNRASSICTPAIL